MAKYTGKDLYVAWIHSGGTEILANGTSGVGFKSLSISTSIDLADATAGDNTYREHLATIQDFTVEYSAVDETTIGSIIQSLEPGTRGTLIVGPRGNGTGAPKIEVVAIVESYDVEYPFDNVVEYSATWRSAGSVNASPFER
ncbi:MAG: hypothetical protein KatS3mg087_1767 [Patescibacteria group bacterium]|nr:MAG: hypothetical protein KatS3mg087_1767 [Patescibacteria group bacterium]